MTRALHCKMIRKFEMLLLFHITKTPYTPPQTFIFSLSGYAHFILGRQYWKFDPVGMNSLEGYPRYVGMDFFGCRNVWVLNQWRIRLTEFFFFFDNEEEIFGTDFYVFKGIKYSPLCFTQIIDAQISFIIFSGKPRYVSSDSAPPVQLHSYLFCMFCPPYCWDQGPV